MCVHMELEWMEQLSKSWTGLLIFMYLYQMPFPLAQMAGGGAFPLSSKLINQSCHIDSKKILFSSILYLGQGLSLSWDILCCGSFGPLF